MATRNPWLDSTSELLCSKFPIQCSSPCHWPCCRDSHSRAMDVAQDSQFCLSRAASLQLPGPVGLGFLIYMYEARPPTPSVTQVTNPTGSGYRHLVWLCLCANAHTFCTTIWNSGRKDTGAWLRPIQLLYWRQSKESNDTLLWKLSRNVKNAFALFLLLLS